MTASERAELIRQGIAGEAVRDLKEHRGWVVVVDWLKAKYVESFETLKDHEDAKARATILVIEELLGDLDTTVKVGRFATDQVTALKDTAA